MPRLRSPAFYLVHLNGDVLETDILAPDGSRRQRAFFVFSSIATLQMYVSLSGSDMRRYNLLSFETLEHVEEFVEQHRDFYEWVVVNPRLGQRSGMEPFGQLVEMARSLVVEEGEEPLRDPAFYIVSLIFDSPFHLYAAEHTTMPVFSSIVAAAQWMRAYEVSEEDWSIAHFFTLAEVQNFVAAYESFFQFITINPAPDPNVAPVVQPFTRLLEIAESIARPVPEQSEAPIIEQRQDTGPTTRPPAAIQESLRNFKRDHAASEKAAFIMMEFGDGWEHAAIAEVIKKVLIEHGIKGMRADDKRYNDHLYLNVQTYMHGCGIGVAVYDRIRADTHNPNVALEVGYMLALEKPVCLLKDKTLPTLHADLVGLLHDNFDTRKPEESIPPPLSKWISDKGLG